MQIIGVRGGITSKLDPTTVENKVGVKEQTGRFGVLDSRLELNICLRMLKIEGRSNFLCAKVLVLYRF
jgi:hypothetical protein